ncbi:MAG TPA: hypothetical protein VM370_10195 [Candidatus Thermoplasmatota archaeon]|nr:hypothetical protein [Candidatus Thermoplasmatota archaeon]
MHAIRPLLVLFLAALAIPFAAGYAPDFAPSKAACGMQLRSTDVLPALALDASAAASAPEQAPDFPRDHPFAFESCTGKIRPGAAMTSPAGCTFSFILTDGNGTLYTGSAGHCVSRVGQRVSASGVGAFGTVVTYWALGVDYALIRIDADKTSLVTPTLCAWGGPIGADPGNRPANDILLEYAWGFATSATSHTRTRALVQAGIGANEISWHGVGSGGDSGGPIVSVEGYAVGSHTRGVTPLAGVVYEAGPTFARMLASGRTAVPTLTLVPGDPTDVELTAQAVRDLT